MNTNQLQPFNFYSAQGYKLSTDPFVWVFETRDPTPQDVNFSVQKQWLNRTTEKLWVLTGFVSQNGEVLAQWDEISSSDSDINSLTGNDGLAVVPSSNNINVEGSPTGAIFASRFNSSTMRLAVQVDNTTISINSSNQLTVNGTGTHWQIVTTNQTLADSKGYILQSPGGALVLTLPVQSAVGNTIEIVLDGATSFTIAQNALQQIDYLTSSSTVGIGGSVQSTTQGNYVRMVCVEEDLRWRILTVSGSIILV